MPIEIAVPQVLAAKLTQQGKSIPPSVSGLGLIDTGAGITGVNEPALLSLGLQSINEIDVYHPDGDGKQFIYACQIKFTGTNVPSLNLNAVTGSKLEKQGLLAIIGRDILKHFQLVYNGIDGFWTLAI